MKNLFLFIIPLFLFACSGGVENKDNELSENNSSDSSGNEMAIYSIPSPLFIGSVLKEMNCGYSPALLDDQRKLKLTGAGKIITNSLLLGLYISDFGYAFINDQQSDMNIFLGKADELIKMLDMQSPVVSGVIIRLKNNLHNRDSVRFLINELQTKIGKHYLDNNIDIVSIYVLTGMMCEGMYLTMNSCGEPDQKSISYLANDFNQSLLQQKSFLINIKEMLKNTGVSSDPALLGHLDSLMSGLKELGISYSVDTKKNRIKYVHLDKSKLPAFREKVNKFRRWIRES